MAGQSAEAARATGFRVLAGAAIALLAGCGESGGGAGGGADAAGGGGGGAPVEGCVDIHADQRSLPEPGTWRRVPGDLARQPFWVDERGVHYVWTANELGTSQAYLVVSTFDRETGAATDNRFYEAFPPELSYSATSIYDVAGSPEGAFAALVDHEDLGSPDGVLMKVVVGHIDQPALVEEWFSPWPVLEAVPFDVGWDGEAFVVHAKRNGETTVLLVRLAPDGTVLTPETAVGAITTFWPDDSVFLTDAGSGKSWMVTKHSTGTWLSGHERDATPFPGTEANGGVLLEIIAGAPLGFGVVDERALFGWHGSSATYLQPLLGTEPNGDFVALPHEQGYGTRKTLAADGVGWWLGMLEVGTGIHAYHLGEGGEVLSKSPLITYTNCSETCGGPQHNILNVHLLSTARFEDELWFGFLDATDSFTVSPEHPASHEPFRIVKVNDGCIYLTEYETNNSPD